MDKCYKVEITNKEDSTSKTYEIPTTVSLFNEELFEDNSYIKDEENYLDIKKLTTEELEKIFFQCEYIVREITLDEKELAEYSQLGEKIRSKDNLAKWQLKEGNEEKRREHILEGLEIVLGYYSRLIKQDLSKEKQR